MNLFHDYLIFLIKNTEFLRKMTPFLIKIIKIHQKINQKSIPKRVRKTSAKSKSILCGNRLPHGPANPQNCTTLFDETHIFQARVASSGIAFRTHQSPKCGPKMEPKSMVFNENTLVLENYS